MKHVLRLLSGPLLVVALATEGIPSALAQTSRGEVHLRVADANGAPLDAQGTLASQATHVERTFAVGKDGQCVLSDVAFGPYRLSITKSGFSMFTAIVDVRSEVPLVYPVTLTIAPVQETVDVSEGATLMDPYQGSAENFVGPEVLGDRPSAPPGRSIINLVNTQPGWLLESNGVLHARGSEYQVQYIVDGVPLTDNRSPAFAQSLEDGDFEALTVRTAGYPAEYGGKLGGVIEVTIHEDSRPGFHGSATFQGGSFEAYDGAATGSYVANRTAVSFTAAGMRTNRYLDPPTEGNFTNRGRGGSGSARVEQTWSERSRTRATVTYQRTTFQVPDEAIQAQAGQIQTRGTSEALAQVTHTQLLSPSTLASLHGMVRSTSATLASNAHATPVAASQDRGLREAYVSGSLVLHRGSHELQLGGEATFTSVREQFSAAIVAYQLGGMAVFDPALPPQFSFSGRHPDREQAVYAQDLYRHGPLTVAAGVRVDHYHLMVDEHAVSPRLSASWYVEPAGLVLHASYDRAFQTPAIENIILASSDLVAALGGEGQQLTLRPSRGNFYEGGGSKTLGGKARVDVNVFTRRATNYADDDLLLNTAVSFPIAFSSAVINGVEAKLEVPHWGNASGSLSYSYSKGTGRLPISGGLFLGSDVQAMLNSNDTFPISQDQRHTIRGRLQYQFTSKIWAAGAASYDSGLPVELDANAVDIPLLVSQYGQAVVDRVDFDAGRVRPSLSLDASVGLTLRAGAHPTKLQADLFNLTNRLNVINFAGLLSGTAVAPRRTFAVRFQTEF